MADSKKPLCKYGEKCYQRNPFHLTKYKHPKQSDIHKKSPSPTQIFTATDNLHTKEDDSIKQIQSPTNSPPKKKIKSNDESNLSDNNSVPSDDIDDSGECSSHSFPDLSPTRSNDQKVNSDDNKPNIDDSIISQQIEYKELLKTPKLFIKNKFLVEMPDDFYKFWEFCKLLAKEKGKPQHPENIFEEFGLVLVGPFDVLSGKFTNAAKIIVDPGTFLRHHRYYYDPPEFQTILLKKKSGLHFGYWRDTPKDSSELLIAKNDLSKGAEISFVAGNLFEVILHFLDKEVIATPFTRSKITMVKNSIEKYCLENNIKLDTCSKRLRARNVKCVCKTFHLGGLIVPVDKKTDLGYRPLIETYAGLKKILEPLKDKDCDGELLIKVLDNLQPLITAANLAVDECDFGNAIELGLNLFSFGAEQLHGTVLMLLSVGYSMIHRSEFVTIIKAHLEQRKHGNYLSMLDE